MDQQMKNKIVEWLTEDDNIFGGVIFFVDEPMSKHTTFKIGGNADILIFVNSMEQLKAIYKLQRDWKFPIYTIGHGSNILVPDKGIDGVVIKMENSEYEVIDNTIVAGAGASLIDLSSIAFDNGLSGLEFASGIPGSVGGAVFMNAGAYGSNISDIVKEVRVVTKSGDIKILNNKELDFGYRQSKVQSTGDIIFDVKIELRNGDKNKIQEVMEDLTQKRKSKQPLNMPSAGSVFKRPDGYFAGKLIDEAGLRGLRHGDAQVSEKHCGFIVNRGHAKADDVMELISSVQKIVYDTFGVRLERELRILGEDL